MLCIIIMLSDHNSKLINNKSQLTWALVIPTYQREPVLLRCLRFAAQQTLLPTEIIVIDASTDWEKTRNKVTQELIAQYPTIDWQYVQANRASSAAQRNQGIERATASSTARTSRAVQGALQAEHRGADRKARAGSGSAQQVVDR